MNWELSHIKVAELQPNILSNVYCLEWELVAEWSRNSPQDDEHTKCRTISRNPVGYSEWRHMVKWVTLNHWKLTKLHKALYRWPFPDHCDFLLSSIIRCWAIYSHGDDNVWFTCKWGRRLLIKHSVSIGLRLRYFRNETNTTQTLNDLRRTKKYRLLFEGITAIYLASRFCITSGMLNLSFISDLTVGIYRAVN